VKQVSTLWLMCSVLGGLGCGDEVVTDADDGNSNTPGAGSDTGAEVSTMTQTETATGTDTSTGTATDTGAHACWSEPWDACFECCYDSHSSNVLQEIYVEQCLCAPDAPCLSECSDNTCETGGPDSECAACSDEIAMTGEHACHIATFELCAADADCAPIGECFTGCYAL